MMFSKKGFTLIELLIVVAIIAILAAIAVPNFLEAQTRAKVSRTKADMRTMATALEAYVVDNNTYPMCHRFGILTREDPANPYVLEAITTPIAYLTSVLSRDPFKVQTRISVGDASSLATATPVTLTDSDLVYKYNSYVYQSWGADGRSQTEEDSFSYAGQKASAWVLHSVGPDGNYYNLGGILANDTESDFTLDMIYNPTNGTVSVGSIWRASAGRSGFGTESKSGDFYAGGEGLLKAIYNQD